MKRKEFAELMIKWMHEQPLDKHLTISEEYAWEDGFKAAVNLIQNPPHYRVENFDDDICGKCHDSWPCKVETERLMKIEGYL